MTTFPQPPAPVLTKPTVQPAGRSRRPDVRRGHSRAGGSSSRAGWLFILPNLLGFLAFTAVPLISGMLLAFTDWNVVSGIEGIRFIGLDNFVELVTDEAFLAAVGRTILYTGVSVPLSMILGLLLALALNSDLIGRGVLRLIFFLPHIVSSIAIGFVWLLILNPEAGILNQALRALGADRTPDWLVSQTMVLPALIIITVWSGVGFQAVIYLSALQSTPPELIEAASLDGAGPLRRFATVTWPSLMPTTTFLLVTSIIGQAQGFGLIAFLTQGGPGNGSTTLAYYMYANAFIYHRFGYAAAIGVVSFIGVAIMTLLLWRWQKGRGLHT